MPRSFEELLVWQRAHCIVIRTYRATQSFPKCEMYGLTAQMRKAASSVPANIVEGHQRRSNRDYLRFLNIAHASLEELNYFYLLSLDLDYLSCETHKPIKAEINHVGKMLSSLKREILKGINQ